jgi:hypothetical protein
MKGKENYSLGKYNNSNKYMNKMSKILDKISMNWNDYI